MSKKNPEYDFAWCPGCGDFGVRRGMELAMGDWVAKHEIPIASNVLVAGIGCSGNMVHLLEGDQPFGFHGVHGRTLPTALGIKMGRPELNVLIAAGDGDFLGIGGEHIAPAAARNLNVCAVIMDNGVYGLTKGQASPTTEEGVVTNSTPYGKLEQPVHPLELYMSIGVSFIASGYSSKPKDIANLVMQGMEHPGFAIVHINSPCTTYNDTYELLKGSVKKGIEPIAWAIPEDHDPTDRQQAKAIVEKGGVPVGVVYRDTSRPTLDAGVVQMQERAKGKPAEELLETFAL